jgi:hypothetical protein
MLFIFEYLHASYFEVSQNAYGSANVVSTSGMISRDKLGFERQFPVLTGSGSIIQ